MYNLFPETPNDAYEVEALYDLVFAPGREALSSYRLRDGAASVAALSRVARDEDGILAGALRFWPVQVGAAAALLLGPIAVHPTRQGEGLGSLLMAEGLEAAAQANWTRVMLVGDHAYYGRFGFNNYKVWLCRRPPTRRGFGAGGLGLGLRGGWSGRVSRP